MFVNAVIFLPAVVALVLLLVPLTSLRAQRAIALTGAVATFALSLRFLWPMAGGMRQSIPWISSSWTAAYHVGVDGWSLFFVLLTTFVSVPVIWAAFSYPDARRLRGYLILLLIFETTLVGLFTAADLLLFYLYWDLMLIPVFLLLVGYTDSPRARRAAWSYLIYNGAGGLILLLGVIGLVLRTHTFEVFGHAFALPGDLQWWLFAAFGLAFLIKTPAWPFHAWMPPTYTEAPPPVVAMVSGVQSKAGLYGLIVLALPLFPNAAHWWAPTLLVLAVIGILYGALIALAQSDAKMLVAFSSLSHLGLVLLALFAFDFTSLSASVLMIVSHGLIAAALFLLLGFIEERVGTRDLFAFGGLAGRAPRLAAFMLIAAMGALGLPGLSGFAGEFLIFIGSWQTQPLFTSIALIVVVLSSVYVLRLFQAAMHGPLDFPELRSGRSIELRSNATFELRPREFWLSAPLLAMIFFLGLWPAWIGDRLPSTAAPAKLIELKVDQKPNGPPVDLKVERYIFVPNSRSAS